MDTQTDVKNAEEQTNNDIYNTATYKRSRKAYICQSTFEYFVTILSADVFLAKLLTSIGISDSLIGIISSFITVAFLFQLSAIFFVQKIVNVKRTVIFFSTLSQLLFMGLFLIPFLPLNLQNKTIIVVVCILSAYIGNYLVASMLYRWGNSFVDPAKRGEYSAGKEAISLICGMAFTLIVGHIIDRYDAMDNLEGGFLFIAIAIFILSVCNFISLLLIKKDSSYGEKKEHIPIMTVMKSILGNRNFINVIIMTSMWDIARYMTIGFLGIYKTKDLMISIGTVQIINIVANLFRVILSKPFGRYSDRHSFAGGIRVALCVAAAAFAINIFTTPKTWWLIIIYSILISVSTAGTNQNSFNITYSYVKSEYFVQASAIKNSIGGILGFCASIAGSKILSYVQANNNTFLGIHIYGQQLLSAISCLIIIMTIIFVHKVVEKQQIMIQ